MVEVSSRLFSVPLNAISPERDICGSSLKSVYTHVWTSVMLSLLHAGNKSTVSKTIVSSDPQSLVVPLPRHNQRDMLNPTLHYGLYLASLVTIGSLSAIW